jgi:NAD(P)-dependent dehydrogenase (short-subunit alcohol dehydrogenase family)
VPGCCLLFDNDGPAGEALATALSERYERVIRVCPAPASCAGEGKLALDPTRPADYVHLLRELKEQRVDTIVYAWGLERTPIVEPGRASDAEAHEALHAVLHLCQALQSELATAPPALLLLTSHGFEVGGATDIDPLHATFAAMAGVIAKELPGTRCRALDVQLPSDIEGLKLLSQQVANEAACRRREDVFAIRGGSLWSRTLVPARATRALSEPASLLRERGVYLVTGGTGGVGLALAERLAARGGASLVLMSRTALECAEPERVSLTDTEGRSLRESVRRMRSAGAEVALFRADVTDPQDVRRAVQFVLERFGRLDGVIHAAGIVDDGIIPLKSPASVSRVLGPKIAGTHALWDAIQALQPDFLVCCSSLSALVTPAGQFDYAAANAFQDAFAHSHDGKGRTRVISINWDGWRDVGMAADLAKRHGENRTAPADWRGLTETDGQDVLELILSNPQPQWVVSTREPGVSIAPSSSKPNAEAARTAWVPKASADELASGQVAMSVQEKAVAAVWHDLLGRESIGAHDNFIALGGDSLLVIQMASQIEARLGRAISVRELMRNPTVSGIAELLES